MGTEHTIICGGIAPSSVPIVGQPMDLNLWPGHGAGQNVTLKIDDLHHRLCQEVPPQFHDLIEIATYVYSADQMISRGKLDVDTFGARWRRRLHFHVPVRVPDLWRSAPVVKALHELLDFLADDFCQFTFYPVRSAPGMQLYLGLDETGARKFNAERVMLFSGGLDSLAGATEECIVQKRRIVLVNHKSTGKFAVRHRELVRQLVEKAGGSAPMHIRVDISKRGMEGKEHTQRARSFLYGAMGATVAMMLGLRSTRFYENGVVSLNLPVCAQVVGGRATRTTHPRTLARMETLFSLLADGPFRVDNPFMWETKGDVVRRIVKAECAPMIEWSRSCAHTWETSNAHTHCGVCSQCIDRRFGILSAEAERHDPSINYGINIFTESRPKDEDKIMLSAFLERANQVGDMTEVGSFLIAYPEATRALRHLGLDPARGAERMLELYRRHAQEVNDGVDRMIQRHSKELRRRTLPPDCLLRTVYDSGAKTVLPVVPTAPSNGSSSAAEVPRYVLRQELKHWRLVWEGEEAILPDEKGVHYVACLLKNPPGEPIHSSELAAGAVGDAVIEGQRNLSTDDAESLAAIGKARREHQAVLDDDNASETEKEEAQQQLDKINEWARKHARGTEANEQRQARAIRQAIRRLLESLAKAENSTLRQFGEHLDRHLWQPSSRAVGRRSARVRAGYAARFTYEPPDGVEWTG